MSNFILDTVMVITFSWT